MTQQSLFQNYMQLLEAVEHCEQSNLLIPALVLIYSAIDSVSWLAADNHKESGKAFKKWTQDWLLRSGDLDCSAEELYAARCGIIHTLTPISSLTSKGVRKIAYSWGTARNEDLKALINLTPSSNELVAVHLSDLIRVFRNAMADYINHVQSDPDLRAAYEKKCEQHFTHITNSRLDNLVKLVTPD